MWQVSALAYVRRLHQLSVITDWQYRTLVIEATQAGYRRREDDFERETSQVIPKVLGMLSDEGVSLRQITSDLAITPAELRGLLFIPLTAVEGGDEGGGARQMAVLRPVN